MKPTIVFFGLYVLLFFSEVCYGDGGNKTREFYVASNVPNVVWDGNYTWDKKPSLKIPTLIFSNEQTYLITSLTTVVGGRTPHTLTIKLFNISNPNETVKITYRRDTVNVHGEGTYYEFKVSTNKPSKYFPYVAAGSKDGTKYVVGITIPPN